MFYLIHDEYVGPNTLDSAGAIIPPGGTMGIYTEPGTKNMSGAVCVDGWLGTTNDNSSHAHGEFETLEAARAAAAELGYTVLAPLPDDQAYSPIQIEEYRTEEGAAAHWSAGDWFSSVSAGELGITAATTDEELVSLATREDEQAASERDGDNPYGVIVHGTEDYLRSLRDDLRAELAEAA